MSFEYENMTSMIITMIFISNLQIICYGLCFTWNRVVEYIQIGGPVWLLKAVFPQAVYDNGCYVCNYQNSNDGCGLNYKLSGLFRWLWFGIITSTTQSVKPC